MTSLEAFEAQLGIDSFPPAWDVWQAAVKWASKQAHDAIEEIDDGEAPEYRYCQEEIRKALS